VKTPPCTGGLWSFGGVPPIGKGTEERASQVNLRLHLPSRSARNAPARLPGRSSALVCSPQSALVDGSRTRWN